MGLPSPQNDYTDFDNLFSGVGENMQGTFVIDSPANGFRYQKEIIATGLPYNTTIRRDNFKVQLLESSAEGARVMFEQDVKYGLNIVASTVPVPIFIAYPTDNEQITTTIINGETIEPADAKNYLDLGYKTEDGIDIDFTSSPGISGGEFRGTWQSPAYKQIVEPGYIFRIVQDGWRPIGLSKIATYKVSYKPSETVGDDGLFDERTGQRFWLRVDALNNETSTNVYRSRRGVSPLTVASAELAGAVDKARLGGARLFTLSGETLFCVATNDGHLCVYESMSAGQKWEKTMDELTDITILASCLSFDATSFLIYGKNGDAPAYVVIKKGENGWAVSESGTPTITPNTSTLPIKGISRMDMGEGGTVRLMVRDDDSGSFRVLVSNDSGHSYVDEFAVGETPDV